MSKTPLDELDADALAMLDALRAEERLPAAVRDRVWSRVAADVAEPPARWSSRGMVLGGLAVAAAVAMLWIGGRALRPTDAGSPASEAGYQRATTTPQRVAEPRGPEPRAAVRGSVPREAPEGAPTDDAAQPSTEPPALEPPATERATESPGAKPSRSTGGRRGSAAAEPPAAPEPVLAPGSTLAEENRLLARARAALLDDRPAQALEHLDAHARRFPAGVLTEERQALHAVALCEAGRHAEGSTAARSFLRAHPRAALAQRVRSACLDD